MHLFPIRRRDAALSELKLSDAVFMPLDGDGEPSAYEPEEPIAVSPANELATELVEHDIVEAFRADQPPPPAEPVEVPAPLSQRHLETIDRMVAHLKSDEKRLEQQITEARRQLADTQLVRHGYELNGANLRRGIALLVRYANNKGSSPRRSRAARAAAAEEVQQPVAANDGAEVVAIAGRASRGRRKMH